MKEPIEDHRNPRVAVATLNAKAYYTATSLLKDMNLPFESVTPDQKVEGDVRLIFTTKGEGGRVKGRRTLYIEDLEKDLDLAEGKILSVLYGGPGMVLTVGVDPGERIGIAAYYHEREAHGEVVNSIDEAVSKVTKIIQASPAERKIVRIGGGNPNMAEEIGERLFKTVGERVEIEIVDERGTSTASGTPGKRGLRDLRSARMIAFRSGRRYLGTASR